MATRRIRDPIHQFIEIDALESEIIDTIPVQRLREIHQLSLGYLVWPGATHTRFEHALGTMELAGRAFDAAVRNADHAVLANLGWDTPEGRGRARQYVRLGALLHDVGHSPFSHGPEELFPDNRRHEHMTVEVILNSEIANLLQSRSISRFDPGVVADIAVGAELRPSREIDIQLLAEIVTGSVGVDRWDYLLRDSLYTGVQYGHFDVHRLLESLTLAERDDTPVWALTEGGEYTAEQMLTARWFMFLNVYCHKTRRILDIHLMEFLKEFLQKRFSAPVFPSEVSDYLGLTDVVVLNELKEHSEHRDRILGRKHFRRVREFRREDFITADDGDPAEAAALGEFRDWISSIGDGRLIPDTVIVKPSEPQEDQFFVLDDQQETVSLLGRLEILKVLRKPLWIGRVYAPPDPGTRGEYKALVEDAFENLKKKRQGGTDES